MIGDVPFEAVIDPDTGVLTWTPNEAFGGSSVSITVRVTDDGEGQLSDIQTFDVTINEVDNLVPEVAVATATVVNGGSLLLTEFNLQATDGDSTEADLEFVIESLPQSGQVFLGGSTLAQFDSFTQQDVLDGLVEYVHDGGTPVADSFGFTVRDLAGNESSLINFGITVTLASGEILGDINLDGAVDFSDISTFISVLLAGEFHVEADINEDSFVDFFDISPFIDLLVSQ